MTPKKILLVILSIAGIAAYIVGSFIIIGIIRGNTTLPFMAKQNTEAATTTLPQTNLPIPTPTATPLPTPTPTPMPPTPTPTPLQGPGIYACDPNGICNNYSADMRAPCPKTFADYHCLGMCGTPTVRCPK